MDKRYILPAIVSTALTLPLLSQTDFEYNLARHRGNKIVLLGDWKPADIGKWREIIDSDGVYEYGFTLLNRERFLDKVGINSILGITEKTVDAFEAWIRQKYGLSAGARWLTLDTENKLIAPGVDVPDAKEFDKLLEQKGIKSPLRKVREFLIENPGHLEAKADLLSEARRRAFHKMPVGASEDLDTESDLRIWGVLAAETDKVFSGSWLGVDLNFFAPHKGQPEKYSKLMKNVFRKHISKVESAIISDPANSTLWNVWAWMARSSPDYNWNSFVASLEPFALFGGTCSPSGDVCVWLVDESRTRMDWDTVIKYAPMARRFARDDSAMDWKDEWAPDGGIQFFLSSPNSHIEGYPAKSAYAPHLEALLRLGDIDKANIVYDEMIDSIDKTDNRFKTNNAIVAADVARSVGMEDLAALWEQGEPINKTSRFNMDVYPTSSIAPYFYLFAERQSDYSNRFYALYRQLALRLMCHSAPWKDDNALGWKTADGGRWALISANGRLLAQDSGIPDKDGMLDIFRRNGIIIPIEFYRAYIAERGITPGIELLLAYEIIRQNNMGNQTNNQNAAMSEDSRDEYTWGEAVRLLRDKLGDPEILLGLPDVNRNAGSAKQSQSMKSLSKSYLANIESLLERKPSSRPLWNQWFFWMSIEDSERPIEPLIERVKYSPLSSIETLPSYVIGAYYDECRKNEKWSSVIELLKRVWERDFLRMNEHQDAQEDSIQKFVMENSRNGLGDRVAMPLIEAYLNDGRPREASEIFNAWLNSGGKFADVSKIVDLAKAKDQERLAREWEASFLNQNQKARF